MATTFDNDPVLRWLPPEPPDAFLLMPDEEQQFRGRAFIVLWAAGYEQEHAWWLVLERNPTFDESARASIARIVDEGAFGEMVMGRAYAEQEIARQATTVGGIS